MDLVFVSDTHLTHRTKAFTDNWRVVQAWIEAAAPSLVVHLGDITAHGADDPSELVAAHDTLSAVSAPLRCVPGNHDIGDNPAGPGVTSEHPLDPARLIEYRRLFGRDYWSLECGPWLLVALNAQLFGTGTAEEAEQLTWIEATLDNPRRPVGLMLHKPLFRAAPEDVDVHVRYVPAGPRARLLHLLARQGLRFVVSGHAHQARQFRVGGVEHVWVPSTAYCFPDGIQERIGQKTVGIMTVALGDEGHRFQLVVPDGLAQHSIADHPEVYPVLPRAERPA